MPGGPAAAYRLPEQGPPDARAEPPGVDVERVQLGVRGAQLSVAVGAVGRPAHDPAVAVLGDQVHHALRGTGEHRAAPFGVLGGVHRVEVRLRHQPRVGRLPAPDADPGHPLAVREGHLPHPRTGLRPRAAHGATTAKASISIRNSGRTSAPTCTAEAAGSRSSDRCAARAARIAPMCAMSVTK